MRGIAIILVVVYHFTWDLSYFRLAPIHIFSPGWQTFARSIGTSFIFLLGLSLTLSYNRAMAHRTKPVPFSKFLRRGGKIFGLGMIITAITYIVIGPGFVIFGILHLLGAGIILAYPFLRINKHYSLAAGLLVIALGLALSTLTVAHPWLIGLGVKQQGRAMVDYYPLLPWFGVTMVGIFLGQTVYPGGNRRFSLPDKSDAGVIRGLTFLGRHTLLIYLLHQPVLIGVLFILGLASF